MKTPRHWPLSLALGLAALGHVFAAESPAPPPAYLRVARPDTNTVQLQVALRKFTPAGKTAPVVWLSGVSHVGDREYYQAVQRHLDEQKLVLFEGIGAGRKLGEAKAKVETPAAKTAHTNESGSLQSTLAAALGLVFQLEAVDYDRAHFRNCDMSVAQIREVMQTGAGGKEPGKASPEFEALLQAMDGSSALGLILKVGLKWLGSNPQMQATAKIMLIETLGRLRGDLAQMRGLPADMKRLVIVLIEARNGVVIAELKAELAKAAPADSISVFYGAGHMEDLEQRLRRELNLEPAGEQWLTAISVDLKQTGLSAAQVAWIRAMVEWQMKQMQP